VPEYNFGCYCLERKRMTVEQKPGIRICLKNPAEALKAAKAKIKIKIAYGPGVIYGFPPREEILAQEGYSVPEITEKLARKSNE